MCCNEISTKSLDNSFVFIIIQICPFMIHFSVNMFFFFFRKSAQKDGLALIKYWIVAIEYNLLILLLFKFK